MITRGANKYDALSRWGITSEKLEGSDRGMKFLGDKKNTCNYFKEIYDPANIFTNWKVRDAIGDDGGPSSWTFAANPT